MVNVLSIVKRGYLYPPYPVVPPRDPEDPAAKEGTSKEDISRFTTARRNIGGSALRKQFLKFIVCVRKPRLLASSTRFPRNGGNFRGSIGLDPRPKSKLPAQTKGRHVSPLA